MELGHNMSPLNLDVALKELNSNFQVWEVLMKHKPSSLQASTGIIATRNLMAKKSFSFV